MTRDMTILEKYDFFVDKMDKSGFIKFLNTLTKEQEENLARAVGERKLKNVTA